MSQTNRLRRTLFRGMPAGLGVLLAVQAKTALGGQCASPSAILSGNTSPRPPTGLTCSGGRSPGFWKVPQKFSYWKPYIPATFTTNVAVCASGIKGVKMASIQTHGTTLSSIFTDSWVDPINPAKGEVGMWAALAFPTDAVFGTNGQLLRHLCAAVLNANYFTSTGQSYPLTLDQIKAMWHATKINGGTYCPSGMTCGGTGWTKDQVILYISGMYDDNAAVEPNLCPAP